MKYEQISAFQPLLNHNINTIVMALQEGSMTKTQFHNKKAYAKRKKDILTLLECVIAWEISNLKEDDRV
jgi:hypothetical protein